MCSVHEATDHHQPLSEDEERLGYDECRLLMHNAVPEPEEREGYIGCPCRDRDTGGGMQCKNGDYLRYGRERLYKGGKVDGFVDKLALIDVPRAAMVVFVLFYSCSHVGFRHYT